VRYVLLAYSSEERSEEVPAGWQELEDVAMATSVRVRDDTTFVADGPFAETEERLSAFRLIDVESLDDAIAVAEHAPAARRGTVEVRPVAAEPGEATG
jgi:hypothetical protein